MQIVVTGGAGFIGGHLVAACLRDGHSVVVLDDLSTGRRDNLPEQLAERLPGGPRLRFVRGDVRDPAACAEACVGADVAFHLAARGSVVEAERDPVEVDAINVGGTATLRSAAHAAGLRRLVFASSCAVYGDQPVPHHRGLPLRPQGTYARTKAAAEAVLRAGHPGPASVVLRLFNVYGPGQLPGPGAGVVPRFVAAALRGEPAVLHGDGAQTRDLVHVRDVVTAMLAASTATLADPRAPLDLGTGRPLTVQALHRAVARALPERPALPPVYAPAPSVGIRHSHARSNALPALGVPAPVPLEAGVAEVAAWLAPRLDARVA